MNLEEAKLKLSKYGQEQILRYYDELSDDEKAALLEQIDKTDMEVLSAIEHKSELVKKGEITPLGAMELDEIEANYDTFKNTGVEAIKAGKSGTAKKHSESVKNQRVLKIKTLWLVSHSKLWLVIRL